MIEGACHCGAVRWRFEGMPNSATACCTVCRRHGVPWADDDDDEGERIHVPGATRAYVRGDAIEFHFRPACGCVSWRRLQRADDGGRRRIAVLRPTEPDAVARLPIEHFDGLDTFDYLPRDGRCVADYWF